MLARSSSSIRNATHRRAFLFLSLTDNGSGLRSFGSSTSLSRPQGRDGGLSADEAVERLLMDFSGTESVRRQILDANQLQKLSLTLGSRQINGVDITETPPPTGTPVPAGWHLVYFTPNGRETELGPDGTDRTFNSPAPFTRRMWAGGRMSWPGGNAGLRVGDEVEERTRLLSATPKRSSKGGDMVLVEVDKEFHGPAGLAVADRRSWIFRPSLTPNDTQKIQPAMKQPFRGPSSSEDRTADGDGSFITRHLRWSPVGLFRFSALTFNGHMIHYNEDWTNRVEGHPGEVVHGPLNLISILNYWRDVHGNQDSNPVSEISYRAVSPIYAGESYSLQTRGVEEAEAGETKTWNINAEKDGVICMTSQIRAAGS